MHICFYVHSFLFFLWFSYGFPLQPLGLWRLPGAQPTWLAGAQQTRLKTTARLSHCHPVQSQAGVQVPLLWSHGMLPARMGSYEGVSTYVTYYSLNIYIYVHIYMYNIHTYMRLYVCVYCIYVNEKQYAYRIPPWYHMYDASKSWISGDMCSYTTNFMEMWHEIFWKEVDAMMTYWSSIENLCSVQQEWMGARKSAAKFQIIRGPNIGYMVHKFTYQLKTVGVPSCMVCGG